MRVWPLLNRRCPDATRGCCNTVSPQKTPHRAAMDRFFSVTCLIRVPRALTGPVERASAPSQQARAMSTATAHSLPCDPASVEFDPLLPRLNLANTRRRWRQLLDHVPTHGWSCRAFLGVPITEELPHRHQTRTPRSVRQDRFPSLNTVEEFDSFQSGGTTALGADWSSAGGGLPRDRGGRTADGVASMGSRWQLPVPRAEHEREHNPARGVIHNVHRIMSPLPRTPTPFYRHLFLSESGALTITRIHLNLPPGGGPNLPLPTSIETTPDASALVTFHRIHWKGSPEYTARRRKFVNAT